MKKITAFLLFVFCGFSLFGQINAADSTVQVVGYWNVHDKQTYQVTEESNKIQNGTDTISKQKIAYLLDVEVLDSTANSYTIQWLSHDVKVINTPNPLLDDLYKLGENSKIIFSVSETGVFKEILNWQEMQAQNQKAFEMLRTKFDTIPQLVNMINGLESKFNSKEAIEGSSVKLINQFYSFHGGKYKLGEELNTSVKLPNAYGGEPFDGMLTVLLDEIDTDNDYSIIRSWQTADSGQLTEFAKKIVKGIASDMNVDIKNEQLDFPPMVNETRIASQIHGNTGWVIYSNMTTEVSLNDVLNIEETTIELQ
ncbi:MAG: hypothetical protein H6Q19_597 [Bacteroidetes bacterium]|nr:hypothetical protein [Bacteroidota bacterium]